MSLKKILFKNTLFNLIGYVYLLFVSFFSISIFLNNLGRDLFGIYLFLASFVPIASIFDFGVSLAAIRELSLPSATQSHKTKVWQTSLAIITAQAILLSVIFLCFLLFLSNTMPLLATLDRSILFPSILIVIITIFINHIDNIFLSIPQAYQRFDVFNSKTFIVGSANTILSALLTYKTQNISHLFLLQFIFHLVTLIYIIFYSKNISGWKSLVPKYDHEISKIIMNFGIKNFIGTLASQIEAQASKFFLGFLSTAQSITSFSIPQNIVGKAAGMVSQFAQAFFPLSSSLLEKDRIVKLKKLYLFLQTFFFCGSLLFVFITAAYGKIFLTWWLADPVVVNLSYPVLQVMSYYFIFVSLTPLPTALVQGLGKPQVASFFAVLTVTFELILLYPFITSFGELGAAYAFLTASIISVPPFLIYSWILLNRSINQYTNK